MRRRAGSGAAVIGRPASGSGPSASARASHSPTASVCGRRLRSIPHASSAASTRAASTGSCRARTLWSILRRSRKPAMTTRHRLSSAAASSRSSAAKGSRTRTADSTLGAGSKASRGTRNATRAFAWYWTKTERYDIAPGGAAIRSATSRWTISTRRSARGGDAEQAVEDRARDVVRQVGDDVVRRRAEVRRGPGRAHRPRRAAAAASRAHPRRSRGAAPRARGRAPRPSRSRLPPGARP